MEYWKPPRDTEDFANSLEASLFLQKYGVSLQDPYKGSDISNLSIGISEAFEGILKSSPILFTALKS